MVTTDNCPIPLQLVHKLMTRGLKTHEAAELMNVCRRRVNDYCEQGRLGYIIQGKYLILPEEAKTFRANQHGRSLRLEQDISIAEVAKKLSLTPSRVKKMVDSGIFGWRSSRGEYHITKKDLARYTRGHTKSYHLAPLTNVAIAKMLGIPTKQADVEISRLIKSGSLTCRRMDGGQVVDRTDVYRYLEATR